MELFFANTKLKKILTSEKELKKHYAPEIANKLLQAMDELHTVPDLYHVSLVSRWRLHELQWGLNGCFSMDINARMRLIIRPDIGVKSGIVDLKEVKSVTIEEVTDTHDGKVRRR